MHTLTEGGGEEDCLQQVSLAKLNQIRLNRVNAGDPTKMS